LVQKPISVQGEPRAVERGRKHKTQRALVEVNAAGLIVCFAFGTDDHGGDMSASVIDVRFVSLVAGDDEQASILE